jgi:hypothetical protein
VSRGRFGLLLGLLFAVVAGGTFFLALQVFDDDEDASTATTTTTTVPITTITSTDELVTPTFVAIVVSETDEATARSMGDQLTEAGFDSGVLHSDDYSSLEPGFWVAYVGPFDDFGGAQAAVGELEGDGYAAAYPRCVGTAEQCS